MLEPDRLVARFHPYEDIQGSVLTFKDEEIKVHTTWPYILFVGDDRIDTGGVAVMRLVDTTMEMFFNANDSGHAAGGALHCTRN